MEVYFAPAGATRAFLPWLNRRADLLRSHRSFRQSPPPRFLRHRPFAPSVASLGRCFAVPLRSIDPGSLRSPFGGASASEPWTFGTALLNSHHTLRRISPPIKATSSHCPAEEMSREAILSV